MPTENRTTLTPDTPVRYLKGVGPKTAEVRRRGLPTAGLVS